MLVPFSFNSENLMNTNSTLEITHLITTKSFDLRSQGLLLLLPTTHWTSTSRV